MSKNLEYKAEFIKNIVTNMDNYYYDNYDIHRFGPLMARERFKNIIRKPVLNILKATGIYRFLFKCSYNLNNIDDLVQNFDIFEYLYNRLEDKSSKALLINLNSYMAMGHRKVDINLNKDNYKKVEKMLKKLSDPNNKFVSENYSLDCYSLNKLGYNISVYSTFLSLLTLLGSGQYYHPKCKVEQGDIIIDAGACFGDSALLFANTVGEEGKIYSFELVSEHKDIFNKNLSLNPKLKNRIEINTYALWDKSGEKVLFHDRGGASRVIEAGIQEEHTIIETLMIDDFVNNKNINKVDFIKMDIEGAELKALVGAQKTIKKFKPKLAISIYHKTSDFKDIPQYIEGLDLGYKFYLGHYTPHTEETVLYATSR